MKPPRCEASVHVYVSLNAIDLFKETKGPPFLLGVLFVCQW